MTCFLPDELYVNNIPGDAGEDEVVGLFEQFGKVREYVVVSKRRDVNLTQAALVRMEDHAGALAVKKALNRIDFKSKQLNIRWSHTQRVIWCSNLHESVTNEILRAAFSQFGHVQRALVVADAQTLATKCFGFVVFENKKDAGRAMSQCVDQPFLIGQFGKPVKVDWARLEDTDQGYSEEVRSGGKVPAAADKDLNHRSISRFAAPGTREYLLAVRMAEVDVEYQQMKQAMRSKMMELQEQLMATGHAPSLATCLATDPHFAAIRAAGAPAPTFAPPQIQPRHMAPPPLGQQPPPAHYAPPPAQYAPPAAPYGPPPAQYAPSPLPLKRANDEFHHVPPPKRSAMRPQDPDFERFNPEASARAHHLQGQEPPKSAANGTYQQGQQRDGQGPVSGLRGSGFTGSAPPPQAPAPGQYGAPYAPPQQYAQYQAPPPQQYGQGPAAAAPPAGPAQPAYNPYAPPPAQQHSYPPPQQQTPAHQQQYAQQQQHAPAYSTAAPQYGTPQSAPQYSTPQSAPQYGTPQPAPQYGTPQPAPQYGSQAHYAAPPPAAYQTSSAASAQTSPPAMSGYNAVGGQQTHSQPGYY